MRLPAAEDVAEGCPAGDGEVGVFVVADQGPVAAGPAVEPELADPAPRRLLAGGIEQGPADAPAGVPPVYYESFQVKLQLPGEGDIPRGLSEPQRPGEVAAVGSGLVGLRDAQGAAFGYPVKPGDQVRLRRPGFGAPLAGPAVAGQPGHCPVVQRNEATASEVVPVRTRLPSAVTYHFPSRVDCGMDAAGRVGA